MPGEKPILMTTESVKAILEGRKSQTRRVIKLKGYSREIWDKCVPHNGDSAELLGEPYLKVPYDPIVDNAGARITCPYGQVGDRLWVKETWVPDPFHPEEILYRANSNPHIESILKTQLVKWKPSLFMPRWASRITLEITEIRVERLQEITEEDAIAEGIVETSHTLPGGKLTAYGEYMLLWGSLNAKRGYPWESNPWVWAISFKRLDDRGLK